MPLSRRQSLFGSAAAGAGSAFVSHAGGVRIVPAVSILGGTLDPTNAEERWG